MITTPKGHVDASAWWLSDPNSGKELAYVVFAASCSEAATAEQAAA